MISGIAKTDCSVILIGHQKIESLRKEYEEINSTILYYEDYIQSNGLPFLDYKMYRSKLYNIKPIQKFQNGIRRISRIIKSYQINDLQGLLMAHRKRLNVDKEEKQKKRSLLLQQQRNCIAFNDENGSMADFKINAILDIVSKQSNQIDTLQKEIKKLRNEINPDEQEGALKSKGKKSSSLSSSSSETSSLKTDEEMKENKIGPIAVQNLEDSNEKNENATVKTFRGISFSNYSSNRYDFKLNLCRSRESRKQISNFKTQDYEQVLLLSLLFRKRVELLRGRKLRRKGIKLWQ